MKKILPLLLSAALFTVACSEKSNATYANDVEKPVQSIGGQKDEHGCLTGAGQTWSQLKNTCIQVFNEGIRLNPVQQKETEAVILAFVVYNKEKTKVELFLADQKDTIILNKSANATYSDKTYKFDPSSGSLYINNVLHYKQDN